MKPITRWKKFLGLPCIKIKDYPDFEKYYFFKVFVGKKKKSREQKLHAAIQRMSEQIGLQNNALKTAEWYLKHLESKINLQEMKLNNIGSNLNTINNNLNPINDNISLLNGELSNLNAKFGSYEGKLNEVDNKLNNTDVKLLGIDNKLDASDAKYIKIESYMRGLPEEISKIAARNLSVAFLHQKTFLKYKNINEGKTVVLLATGPTLSKYEPIENTIHIGVNSAFMFDKVMLDYLFMLDYENIKKYIDAANNYGKGTCKKFYGLFKGHSRTMHIPESDARAADAERYYINNSDLSIDEQFNYDISCNSLGCFWSVIFQAAQFALYTNPAKIYIVGCDCSENGHFDSDEPNFKTQESAQNHMLKILDGWNKLKEFARVYYPQTEIISVNPVGLKGLFTDVYTNVASEV